MQQTTQTTASHYCCDESEMRFEYRDDKAWAIRKFAEPIEGKETADPDSHAVVDDDIDFGEMWTHMQPGLAAVYFSARQTQMPR